MGFATHTCGAAALTLGAAFYAFLISKMYQDYLEDYVYKLLAIIGSRICKLFSSKGSNEKTKLLSVDNENDNDKETKEESKVSKSGKNTKPDDYDDDDIIINEEMSKLNFHMMMFLLWLIITIINIPILLTWARNFKYCVTMKDDSSYIPACVMTVCSGVIWQLDLAKRKAEHYDTLANTFIPINLVVFLLGPFTLSVVNYGVILVFIVITLHQLIYINDVENDDNGNDDSDTSQQSSTSTLNDDNEKSSDETEEKNEKANENETDKKESDNSNKDIQDECNVCDENKIFKVLKNLKDKFSFSNDV
ncbi:hypothetical protein RR46_14224 [Papilio xuthus]|uniref:Uncharacterized protein n=1 Tax=Papilio xuthus TaxID=66420 RepID=A0A194PIX7_PAPXU|nr:hypothetical protein RR46_14224 [Papilio xuthus]